MLSISYNSVIRDFVLIKWMLLNGIAITSLMLLAKVPTVEATNDSMNIILISLMN